MQQDPKEDNYWEFIQDISSEDHLKLLLVQIEQTLEEIKDSPEYGDVLVMDTWIGNSSFSQIIADNTLEESMLFFASQVRPFLAATLQDSEPKCTIPVKMKLSPLGGFPTW